MKVDTFMSGDQSLCMKADTFGAVFTESCMKVDTFSYGESVLHASRYLSHESRYLPSVPIPSRT